MNEEIERLLHFESFLRFAKQKEHKLISAVYKYSDYLLSKGLNYTDVEIDYCYKRILKEGGQIKKGFWFIKRNEMEQELKRAIIKT